MKKSKNSHFENVEQMLIENIADFLDKEEILIQETISELKDPIIREKSELHIRMAKIAMNEYENTMNNKESLIGKELFYRSAITKCYTKFKVKNIVLNMEIISKEVCFSVELISENNNKYIYEEDYIFTEPLNPPTNENIT